MSLIQLLKFKKMRNEAFQNASFGSALFPNGNEGNNCLWAECYEQWLIQPTYSNAITKHNKTEYIVSIFICCRALLEKWLRHQRMKTRDHVLRLQFRISM